MITSWSILIYLIFSPTPAVPNLPTVAYPLFFVHRSIDSQSQLLKRGCSQQGKRLVMKSASPRSCKENYIMSKTSDIIHDQNVVDIFRRCSRQRTRSLKLVHVKGLWVKDLWGLKNSLIAMESTSLLQVGQEFPGRNSTRRFVLIICTTSTHNKRAHKDHKSTYKVVFPLLLLWDFVTAWVMFFSFSYWFKMI